MAARHIKTIRDMISLLTSFGFLSIFFCYFVSVLLCVSGNPGFIFLEFPYLCIFFFVDVTPALGCTCFSFSCIKYTAKYFSVALYSRVGSGFYFYEMGVWVCLFVLGGVQCVFWFLF